MDISANFAFLQENFPYAAESASLAERQVYADPRASCFHARHALERLVKRVYKVDRALSPPKVEKLVEYLAEPAFRVLVPEVVWQKAEYIRLAGNDAVHGKKSPAPEKALAVLRELFHVVYWVGRTYVRRGAEALVGKTFDETLVPKVQLTPTAASVAALEKLKKKLDAAADKNSTLESELEALREKLAAIKAENEKVADTHDWNEAETRLRLIDLALERAGWSLDQKRDREFEVTGMPNNKGVGYVDYVLWGDDGKPLAVIEAKRTMASPTKGQQQAKLYADCLEQMYGQRPIIFFTNGYKTFLWDDTFYPRRAVAGFYKKNELARLIVRRELRAPIDVSKVNDSIVERYYQKRAIASIGEHFAGAGRKALLVMATGSGKTRTAIALVDLLQRSGWVKRVLFLADRISLVKQAAKAFKTHLPESSPVNLVTGKKKKKTARVYVSTYQTMMGLIDETEGSTARFGVGHFDLIVIDEAHRSVYQRYSAIFRYFDSLLVGLTATPREHVDKNTYTLFGLTPGEPTDAYELETAVDDGFLVPARVQQVDLKFPSKGIDYKTLSDAEKEQWESLEWGEEAGEGLPDSVNASAVNNWLFNTDTVDKVLQHVMEHGHKVEAGDRLAKTIFFARNHDHAEFIEERFNHHYPHYKGHFARVIDHYATYAQDILDDFSDKEKEPHIAISVDMLDTGIDVPEVANLVFFKPVYSKIKFLQMIGRGTRLCLNLYGPDDHKKDFRIFDFCSNFDFFEKKPDGIETGAAVSLGARLFQGRVRLLCHVQQTAELDPESRVANPLAAMLREEVAGMNRENFLVRMHLEAVDRFRDAHAWGALTVKDQATLHDELAGLPSDIDTGGIEARLFDLTALRMQLALAESDEAAFEKNRQRVVEIAQLLEDKKAVPAVEAQLVFLRAMQDTQFWQGIRLADLEDLRLRMRGLVAFLDKKKRKIVYTDFEDEVTGIRDDGAVYMPMMTSAQYEIKVKRYLDSHLDHLVIHRLRTNQPLTAADLEGLETTLAEIGEAKGAILLRELLERREAPSLAHFVRSLVGMDRSAAHAAFSEFLNDRSLTTPQIRFVEMVIDQLTSRGVMKPEALYEAPFTSLHAGGPDALFGGRESVIDGLFETLKSVHSELPAKVG